MAGERRTYNANQIYRDPAWRKTDPEGALRMHPGDARALGLVPGARVRCRTDRSSLEVCVEEDDSVRRGVVILPHGYGQRYGGESAVGPAVNRLTSTSHCDPLSKTPLHKYVPVHIEPLQAPQAHPPLTTEESAS
jgi:anaerobic selenocysteine-containing dehydrogenase